MDVSGSSSDTCALFPASNCPRFAQKSSLKSHSFAQKNIQGLSIDVSPREVDQPPTCFFDLKKGRALEETTIKIIETPSLDL